MRRNIFSYFSQGDERERKAKKNIAFSFFLKGFSALTSLIVVPLTIDFVSPVQYGIWLTLSSIIGWMNFFDIGLANGLKNKLTEALAKDNFKEAKVLVSTSYIFVAIISVVLFLVFLSINHFLDWSKILNTDKALEGQLKIVTIIIFGIFSTQFVFQLINTICIASHDVRLSSLISFLGNLLGLILVFSIMKVVKGSLLALCLSIGIAPLIILAAFSIFLFRSKYRLMSPSFRMVDYNKGKEIILLGSRFFIIQLGLLFFYNVDNIIITQVSGPLSVTAYGIAYKYFNIITMVSGIVMTPYWPAFTEAHIKGDKEWIVKTVKNLQKKCLIIFGVCLLLLIISNQMYILWVGGEVTVPFSLSVVLAVYVSFNTYRTIFVYYLNATNKINIQIIIIFLAGILNVPMGFLLGRHFGPTGVILATTILCILCGIVEIVQYKKIINNNAYGIWNT